MPNSEHKAADNGGDKRGGVMHSVSFGCCDDPENPNYE